MYYLLINMRNNTTLPLGSISIIDKIEKDFGLISGIFGKAGGKTRNFVGAYSILPRLYGVVYCCIFDESISL